MSASPRCRFVHRRRQRPHVERGDGGAQRSGARDRHHREGEPTHATGQLENAAEVGRATVLDPDTSNNRVTFTTPRSAPRRGWRLPRPTARIPWPQAKQLVYTLQSEQRRPIDSAGRRRSSTPCPPAPRWSVRSGAQAPRRAHSPSGPGVVSCDVGDLDPGQSVTIFITVEVNSNVAVAGTILTNIAKAHVADRPGRRRGQHRHPGAHRGARLWIEKTGVKPAGNPAGALDLPDHGPQQRRHGAR